MKIQFIFPQKNKQMERNRNQLVKDFVIYYVSVQDVSKDDSASTGICYQICGPSSVLESAQLKKRTSAIVLSSDLCMHCLALAGSMVTLFINK